jgi:putative transposase
VSSDDAALLEATVKVRSVNEFAATYGSPRVWLELRRQGFPVGRKRVERITRTHGLQGAHLRRGWKHGSTRQHPERRGAPDLLERDFRAEAPNRASGGRPDPAGHRRGRAVARLGA